MEDVALIIFMAFVIPLWLVLYYVTKWKKDKAITPEDEGLLSDLRRNADKLESRLDNLERILDAEVPEWRQKYHDPL